MFFSAMFFFFFCVYKQYLIKEMKIKLHKCSLYLLFMLLTPISTRIPAVQCFYPSIYK